jgi:hypothetical protein
MNLPARTFLVTSAAGCSGLLKSRLGLVQMAAAARTKDEEFQSLYCHPLFNIGKNIYQYRRPETVHDPTVGGLGKDSCDMDTHLTIRVCQAGAVAIRPPSAANLRRGPGQRSPQERLERALMRNRSYRSSEEERGSGMGHQLGYPNVLQPYGYLLKGLWVVLGIPRRSARPQLTMPGATGPVAGHCGRHCLPRVPFCGRETPWFPDCRPVSPTHPASSSALEHCRPGACPDAICPRAPAPGSDCKVA